jgi:hypothetical protein
MGRTVVATTDGNVVLDPYDHASSCPRAAAAQTPKVAFSHHPKATSISARLAVTLDAATAGRNRAAEWQCAWLSGSDDLPRITGAPTPAGALSFAPATITFLAVPTAANNACR